MNESLKNFFIASILSSVGILVVFGIVQRQSQEAALYNLKQSNDPCAVNFNSETYRVYGLEAIIVDASKTLSGAMIFLVGAVSETKEIKYTFYINDNGNISLQTIPHRDVVIRYTEGKPHAYGCSNQYFVNEPPFEWVVFIPQGGISNTYNIDVEKTNIRE